MKMKVNERFNERGGGLILYGSTVATAVCTLVDAIPQAIARLRLVGNVPKDDAKLGRVSGSPQSAKTHPPRREHAISLDQWKLLLRLANPLTR